MITTREIDNKKHSQCLPYFFLLNETLNKICLRKKHNQCSVVFYKRPLSLMGYGKRMLEKVYKIIKTTTTRLPHMNFRMGNECMCDLSYFLKRIWKKKKRELRQALNRLDVSLYRLLLSDSRFDSKFKTFRLHNDWNSLELTQFFFWLFFIFIFPSWKLISIFPSRAGLLVSAENDGNISLRLHKSILHTSHCLTKLWKIYSMGESLIALGLASTERIKNY